MSKEEAGERELEKWGLVTSHDSAGTNSSAGLETKRTKRAIIGQVQFMKMRLSGTGKSVLDFENYGNWCGVGGSGGCVDAIDDCCYTHDKCWYAVKKDHKHNCFYSMWLTTSSKNPNDPCSTTDQKNVPRVRCCRCDWQFAGCIANHHRVYNSRYKKRSFDSKLFNVNRGCNKKW